jgi:uncharacterized membrane protein (DUF485 family)
MGPLLVEALRVSAWHGLALVLSFYVTFITLLALTVLLFDRARRLNPRVTRALIGATAILLLVFGLLLIRQGAGLAG